MKNEFDSSILKINTLMLETVMYDLICHLTFTNAVSTKRVGKNGSNFLRY